MPSACALGIATLNLQTSLPLLQDRPAGRASIAGVSRKAFRINSCILGDGRLSKGPSHLLQGCGRLGCRVGGLGSGLSRVGITGYVLEGIQGRELRTKALGLTASGTWKAGMVGDFCHTVMVNLVQQQVGKLA